tara:strand:+ start:722 stop:1645 length:924 start_codon:yes stop_codon:yes gene_type:complete
VKTTEQQLRTIIRKKLLGEAWNDDITNMFANLLDWLTDAYDERSGTASKTANAIRWKPDDEEKFKASAEAMGIKAEEATAILEKPETVKSGDKNHAALLAAIYSSKEYSALLEEVMKDLKTAAGLVEGMSDEDPKKSKEASDKVMGHLGGSFGTASGIASAIKGDYAGAFKNFIGGAKKVTGAKELQVWAQGISEFGKACDEMAGMIDKAASFVPEAEAVNSVIDGSVWKQAGPAISGEADKLVPILEKMSEEAEEAPEEVSSAPTQVTKGTKAEADGVLISAKQAEKFGIETKQESLMRNFLKEVL